MFVGVTFLKHQFSFKIYSVQPLMYPSQYGEITVKYIEENLLGISLRRTMIGFSKHINHPMKCELKKYNSRKERKKK